MPLTKNELVTIHAIADRAVQMYERMGHLTEADARFARAGIANEIMTVHCEIVPLRLNEFLDADVSNFAHDIGGIHRHLEDDGGTPRLKDCFLPRFASV